MIKFLLDMGIAPICKKWLSELGFDSFHLSDRNLHTLSDSEIILIAKAETRVILTCDNDFGTILALNNSELPSVILFRVSNFNPKNIFEKLQKILEEVPQQQLESGILITVNDNNFRIRKLPMLLDKPKI